MRLIKENQFIFFFIVAAVLMHSNAAHASGDIVFAGLLLMAAMFQLIAIVWVLVSKKLKGIRLYSLVFLIVIFSLFWLIPWGPSSKGVNIILFMGNAVPVFVVVVLRLISTKLATENTDDQ